MTEKYAELTLYVGISSAGLQILRDGPFEFNPRIHSRDTAEQDHVRRWEMGMETARFAVYDNIGLTYAVGGCLRDEKEARKLIDYAEREIPGSEGVIELVDALHGSKVRFRRKLVLPRFTKDREGELVEKLEASGCKFDKEKPLRECLKFF